MNKQLPDGWLDVVIGEIGMMYSGLSGKSANDFGHGEPYLTYKQVFSGTVNRPSTGELVSVGSTEKQNRVTFGDILFTTSSETPHEIGMTSVYLQEEPEPFLNSFCFGLRPNAAAGIYPEFSCHLFRGEVFRTKIRPLAQGSTRYNLSKTNLAKLTLSIPPLPEQKKIAAILTSVDDVIENTQAQIAKLQDLKKATMNELLTKGIGHTEFKDSEFGQIPEEWDIHRLSHLVDNSRKITYGIVQTEEHLDDGVPCVRVVDIVNGSPRVDRMIRTSRKISESYKRTILNINDILFALRGKIGHVHLVSEQLKNCNLTRGIALISSSQKIKSRYLYWALQGEAVRKQIMDGVNGSALQEIPLGNLREIKIPVPDASEQSTLIQIIDSLEQNIEAKKHSLNARILLKKALMNDLLTGKVRVNVN